MSYDLQAFTWNSLSADAEESLTEHNGSWYAWDWTFVEGAGDGVIWDKGTNDWRIEKTSNGYKLMKLSGGTWASPSGYQVNTADTFQPDSNGLVTITFNWSSHTGVKFKPPSTSSGGSGGGTINPQSNNSNSSGTRKCFSNFW